jgi:threonine/homoserine/homoserine lactone efflux protein
MAGMLNILGTQLGLAFMLITLVLGFSALVSNLSGVFDIVRILGAIYLAWLGIQLLRANGSTVNSDEQRPSGRNTISLIWQGFVVIWSNPKALFFFGAFLPQFVDLNYPITQQLLVLGAMFMLIGLIFDGAYAMAAGKAGSLLTQTRVIWVERLSGTFLIAGSLWLVSRRSV